MNSFWKKLLIVSGLNILSFFIFCLPMLFSSHVKDYALGFLVLAFVLLFISFIGQIIAGLKMLGNTEKRDWGKAMLLSVGVCLLIGFSLCSKS